MNSLLESKKVTIKTPDFTATVALSIVITAISKEVLDRVQGTDFGGAIDLALRPVGNKDC